MPSIRLLLCLLPLLSACSGLDTRQPERAPQRVDSTDKSPVQPAIVEAFGRALRDMRQGREEQARAQFEQLIQRYPTLIGPYVNLGILQAESEPEKAEASFRAALQIDPGHAVANNRLGLLLRHQGRFAEAENAYLAALSQHPDYLPVHRNIGILYDLYLGQPPKALHHYQRCQELLPEPDTQIAGWIIDLQQRTQEP